MRDQTANAGRESNLPPEQVAEGVVQCHRLPQRPFLTLTRHFCGHEGSKGHRTFSEVEIGPPAAIGPRKEGVPNDGRTFFRKCGSGRAMPQKSCTAIVASL